MANYYVRTTGGNDGNSGTSVGDGWETIAQAQGVAVAGDAVFLCTMSVGESFATAPAFYTSGSTASGVVLWTGANHKGIVDGTLTVIDDDIDAGSGSNLSRVTFQYLSLNGGGFALVQGVGILIVYRCKSVNASGTAFYAPDFETIFLECYAENSADNGFQMFSNKTVQAISCVSFDNPSNGFEGHTITNCIAANNGASGFECNNAINCTACNNLTGIKFNTTTAHMVVNSLLVNNTTAIEGDMAPYILKNNAFFGNDTDLGSGFPNSEILVHNSVALETDPFISATNNDFRLNGLSGGRACKHAGVPTSFPNINTTSFVDIGAHFPEFRKVLRS